MTTIDDIMALAGDYFDCGVLEGRERREVDTPEGSAQKAMHALRAAIKSAIDEEREWCAKVVEDYCGGWDDGGYLLVTEIRKGPTP